MKDNEHTPHLSSLGQNSSFLKELIREIVHSKTLEGQRRLIKEMAAELKISYLDCAAALVALHLNNLETEVSQPEPDKAKVPTPAYRVQLRFVRYRLAVGQVHHIELDQLKRALVEESGVDIRNIANARIYDSFTLIDLPDEMPQEIFLHLKTVEINGQKLDIRRVKSRHKTRGHRKKRLPKANAPVFRPEKDVSR